MDKKEILLLRETERKRIAEALHDTTVQDMVCLSQQLELISLYMDQDTVRAQMEVASARRHLKCMMNEMRDIIYDLRPVIIDDIGWTAAFERLRDKMLNKNPDLHIHFDIDEIDPSDGITAISIYRIICEGCQNIAKHSAADDIKISVKNTENSIRICICDNGIGMAEEKNSHGNHFGLQFMDDKVKALSGKMKMDSDSFGTKIEIEIPVG